MMARLPQPGGDSGNWGDILNDYLSQTLKNDGTLKEDSVSASALAPNSVTSAAIVPDAVDATAIANGSISEVLLDLTVQTKLNAVAGTPDWNTITNKPAVIAAGIDQAAARAVISAGTSNLIIGTTATTAKAGNYQPTAANISDATAIGRSVLTAPDAAAVRTAIGAGTASTKADVGLGNVDNTADSVKPVSTATQTALSGKVSTSRTVDTTGSLSGGGDLAANRTISLVNDSTTPGTSRYYGTDGSGTKGYFTLPAGSAGEINTASSVGAAGVGVFKQKTGVNLEFKSINAASNKVTVTNDAANNEIDIDVAPANFTGIPESAVTNLTSDLTAKIDKSILTTKGDIVVATGSSTPTRVGIGTDGQILTVDSSQAPGVKWVSPSTGSNLGYVTNVGNGTSGPYTITHNLGSRDVLVNVYKNGSTYEEIMVRTDRVTKDTVVLRPDETWTTNQYRVVVGFIYQSDVTAPSAPVLVHVSHDISMVALSVSGATDTNGVVGYNWYRNNVYIASTPGTTYTHTGLNSATSYDFTTTAVDLVGNESAASNTITQVTDAPANVAYVSSGTGNRNTASGATSWTHTIANGVSRYMVVGIILSNTGGHWQDVAGGYSTKTVTSDLGTGSGSATLSLLGSSPIGNNGQPQGNVLLYGIANPAVGTHTITTSYVGVQGPVAVMGSSMAYTGVGSVGTAIVSAPNASGALALTVTSAVNSMAVAVAGFDGAPTGFNRTTRYSNGGSIGGQGDYGIIGDAAGAASVSFTTSSTAHYRSGVGINLIKAS